ncbi:MAG: ABC transporter substrate-binding protein [Clostridium sp.]
MKKIAVFLGLMLSLTACNTGAKQTTATSAVGTSAAETSAATTVENKEIPTLNVGWSNELHTGNMELSRLIPDAFKDNAIHLNPISDSQSELIRDGETIAYINHVLTKGASECATLLSQGHLDVAYCSSTAMFTTYDKGTDVSILAPIQSGGVSIVAAKDAPYSNFDELVAYAKSAEKPLLAGYHSPISSPRLVLEYALKEAGVVVTEDPADYSADVLLMDLKGIGNLIPALSSGQVEFWAAPVPNPQNAIAQGIAKKIATLDELPGGKWVDFPCCTMNVLNSVKTEYPEVLSALASATRDIMDYANTHREETASAIADYVGMKAEDLSGNDTTYTTTADEKFITGMNKYYDVMTEMGKFEGRFSGKTYSEIEKMLFDFDVMKNAK